MIRKDKWPFIPESLSEIFPPDTLSVLESGCCERIRRPLTILVRDITTGQMNYRVESINEKQHYERFCGYLRDEVHVSGMDRRCKVYDIKQAALSLAEYQKDHTLFRIFTCHMGLTDMTCMIEMAGYPVALIISGQYCHDNCNDSIAENVLKLGRGAGEEDIRLDDEARQELGRLAQLLPPVPPDTKESMEREASHIQRMAEDKYARLKREMEQEFLDELQKFVGSVSELTRESLTQMLTQALEEVQAFCRCKYVVFFGSIMEGDVVLAPLASCGLPLTIQEKMPHFNWKKGGIPAGPFDMGKPDISTRLGDFRSKGVRGDNVDFFSNAACILPVMLGSRYRGALLLGPFVDKVDIKKEQRFLYQVADTIGLFTLSGLELINLDLERRHWEKMAHLLSHQMGTVLTPINTLIGRAKYRLQNTDGGLDTARVIEFINQAEDMTIMLANSARETLEGRVLNIKKDDLKEIDDYQFEHYPLSVLVSNCANSFIERAREKRRELVIESSVELLPDADIDVARLTIVLANLIDNAIKYSHPDTKIFIRAHLSYQNSIKDAVAVIEVDDIGMGIRADEEDHIFEQGTRSETAQRAGIFGSGFGLWEAAVIAKTHEGRIYVKHWPVQAHHRESPTQRVVFSLEIPLIHKQLAVRTGSR